MLTDNKHTSNINNKVHILRQRLWKDQYQTDQMSTENHYYGEETLTYLNGWKTNLMHVKELKILHVL